MGTVSGNLRAWADSKIFSFTSVAGAYLTIYGEDTNNDMGGSLGGFWADCGSTLPASTLSTNWQSYCTTSPPDSVHQLGLGSGWQASHFHPGDASNSWGVSGELGDSGKKYCVFRALPTAAEALNEDGSTITWDASSR